MKTHSRTRSLGGLVAVGALALAACGGGGGGSAEEGSGTGSISVWAHEGQEGEVDALKNAVEAFNSSQSDIEVELRLIPEADYTKTVQATSVGDLPDVLEYDGPLLVVLRLRRQALADLRLRQRRHARQPDRLRDRPEHLLRRRRRSTGSRCSTPVSGSTATRRCSMLRVSSIPRPGRTRGPTRSSRLRSRRWPQRTTTARFSTSRRTTAANGLRTASCRSWLLPARRSSWTTVPTA